jgi:hypothetical protein
MPGRDASTCREEEYYRRSTDFGATWDAEVRLTHDPVSRPRGSWAPSIAVWENNVHVAFFDRRTATFGIYYKRSRQGGAASTWEPERRISPDSAVTHHARPVIDALGPFVHVVWFSATPFDGVDVWHAGSADNGATFGTPLQLNPHAGTDEMHAAVAVSPSRSTHVIWQQTDAQGVDRIVHRARRSARPSPASPWN